MQLLTAFTALTGLTTALTIPPAPLLPRGASIPTLENYTGTYLRNNAISIPPLCSTSLISFTSFPSLSKINATQCRDTCQHLSTTHAATGNPTRCRYFNIYMLFLDDTNLGMQCQLYDRKWNNSYATNSGQNTSLWTTGKSSQAYEVSDSYAYWTTGDQGDMSCGASAITSSTTAPFLLNLTHGPARPVTSTTKKVLPRPSPTPSHSYTVWTEKKGN